MTDSALFLDARLNDLNIPPGKYYLADAGFGSCDATLVPYRSVRYHLAEWGRANVRSVSISLFRATPDGSLNSDRLLVRSCIIYGMHKPGMSSSAFSGSSRANGRF